MIESQTLKLRKVTGPASQTAAGSAALGSQTQDCSWAVGRGEELRAGNTPASGPWEGNGVLTFNHRPMQHGFPAAPLDCS